MCTIHTYTHTRHTCDVPSDTEQNGKLCFDATPPPRLTSVGQVPRYLNIKWFDTDEGFCSRQDKCKDVHVEWQTCTPALTPAQAGTMLAPLRASHAVYYPLDDNRFYAVYCNACSAGNVCTNVVANELIDLSQTYVITSL